MKRNRTWILAILLACPCLVSAEDMRVQNQDRQVKARMGEIKDEARFHAEVDKAAVAYSAIVKGPHGEVPASVLSNARCIAVFPSIVTGALVLGVTHGQGLVSCRTTESSWSQPAVISLNQGSIGLQAGAKSADLVMFFQDKDSVIALKQGDFTFGTDVSAVAGSYDSSANSLEKGVVVYSRAEGVFAGASVSASNVKKNQDELVAYYGTKVDYTALLEGRESPDSSTYTKKLTKLFPEIVRG